MTLPPFRTVARHPAAVVLRLVLWPTVIVGLSDLASRTEDDALAGGLMAFFVIAVLAFLLPLLDGLVLRALPLLLVWSVVALLVVAWLSAPLLVGVLTHDPHATTWDYALRSTLEDLPFSATFFLVLVGVPAALGGITGFALRRTFPGTAGRPGPTPALEVRRG